MLIGWQVWILFMAMKHKIHVEGRASVLANLELSTHQFFYKKLKEWRAFWVLHFFCRFGQNWPINLGRRRGLRMNRNQTNPQCGAPWGAQQSMLRSQSIDDNQIFQSVTLSHFKHKNTLHTQNKNPILEQKLKFEAQETEGPYLLTSSWYHENCSWFALLWIPVWAP